VVDYHYVHEKVALSALVTQFVFSLNQLVDIFAKPLSWEAFTTFSIKLGLTHWPSLRGSIRTNNHVMKELKREPKSKANCINQGYDPYLFSFFFFFF
jgi:hypothetical protein